MKEKEEIKQPDQIEQANMIIKILQGQRNQAFANSQDQAAQLTLEVIELNKKVEELTNKITKLENESTEDID